jgi:UDP-glucose 4-epimerase
MTKALVTGVAGFMGSHVADHCVALGMEVVGVDDLSGGFVENVPAGITFVEGSVADRDFVARTFEEHRFDHVYHLAAYAAEGLSHFIRNFNYDNNLRASVDLVNHSVLTGVQCFVFTSSIAVYGAGQTPMTEEMTPQPEDPYGISKYAVELDLAAAHRIFGIDYIVFRPHNVYGERQNIADRYRNVIGIFMNQIMHGEPMTVFGDGRQTRAFSHIDDVAPAIARAPVVPAARNEVFNIGADQPYTILELAETIAGAFRVEPRFQHLPPRNEVVDAFSSHQKVRHVFDLGAPIDLVTGIGRMAEWARERGPTPRVDFKGEIEVPLNLPPSWQGALNSRAGARG